jgi:hypothetical protein
MESPTYILISYNKLDEPLYFLLLFGELSNKNVGWIEFKGSRNNSPGIKETSKYLILLFNSELFMRGMK